MTDPSKKHGFFSLNELITTDLEAAKAFYGNLFGWRFAETKTIYGNRYLTAFKDGAFVGGMMLKEGNVPDDVAPCWDPYLSVDDVELSAKQAEELGGEIVLPPTDIPNVGRFCVVKDPQGVSFNLIEHKDQA
ncbi:VOC family protein [Desulfoluna butyratoxydans]|uniref:Glyoxalase/bleomycin resistance protein/dihydroxybiphenyl dioxygenase n=1 Tax=Desulfoluna butyratoxydans TaxID=231438 RepID=A0A4U8YHS8_9BACT|nr:VOC family protein [Desulfoluna butyratoxydans]VFQ42797.1 glyoxalase/bleomycin resistance protein/dihydroxybiphenyl dioxygenase [Desulfoluna butyratoxydans]